MRESQTFEERSGGSMWFAPVSQAKGSKTRKQVDLATQILNKHGLDYVGEFIVGQRTMHHLIDVLYDRTDPQELKATHACFDELLDEFAKAGDGVYRVNPEFMGKVANSFGPPGAPSTKRSNVPFDPNNLLAPGKSGIDLNA